MGKRLGAAHHQINKQKPQIQIKSCQTSIIRKIQKKTIMEKRKENHSDITLYTRTIKNFKV